ncbi:MAG TPA: flagellin [Spirochaetota bacterium]|nr:flagellin [Spirochaetota bacterium]
MIINHNLSAINANRLQNIRVKQQTKTMEKLASGERINKAGDDASGLAVTEKMRAQIMGLHKASENAVNGISFIQSTEGYLQESQDVLKRIRELAVQASNGIYSAEDRMQIQVEVSQLVDEVDRIASHAEFNELPLLQGQFARSVDGSQPENPIWFHIGANMDQRIKAYVGTMTADALKVTDVSISTPDQANKTIGMVDEALTKVSKQRADLGAVQNRMELLVKGQDIAAQNLQAAESKMRDTNMALATVELSRNNILAQASTAMLAQANMKNNLVMRLLG